MDNLRIQQQSDGIIFHIKVVPGSSRTAICGLLDGAIKIKVSAAPQKGKANQSLITFLAKNLRVKKSDVNIVSGQTNALKQIRVEGVSKNDLIKILKL